MPAAMKAIALTVGGLSFIVTATSAAMSEDTLARGTELVRHVAACGQCHTPLTPSGTPIASLELAGGITKKLPLGTITPPNITPDLQTGIGSWTDQDVVNALRTGRRPDGTIIGPPMPIVFYRKLSDSDAFSIAKYLKSIPPIKRVVPKSVYKVSLPTSYGPPVNDLAAPSRSDKVAYGKYLAGIAHCVLCHTPLADGRMDASRLGAGGRKYLDDDGGIVVSANITPDRADGIGSWTDKDIKTAITQGVTPRGLRLNSYMPSAYFSGMTPDDLDAIVAYLRTLKPLASN
jgi:mono/diheme cytochrome c family protein